MPWISREMCTGCQLCVDECIVGAISMEEEAAVIDEDECIRCGVCHDVCPNEAVRHDGERIPAEVESNLAWIHRLLDHPYYVDDQAKRQELFDRLRRHFVKNRKVVEKTLERLEGLQTSQTDQA